MSGISSADDDCGSFGVAEQGLPGPIALVLLAGQSNMAGRGPMPFSSSGAGELRSRQQCASLHSSSSSLPTFAWTAAGRWSKAQHPLHWDKPDKVGVGPGLSFAESCAVEDLLLGAASPQTDVAGIGLVPTAVGGSGILEWLPDTGQLLSKALARTEAALRAAPTGSFVSCILWHQGETDAGSADLAAGYRERLKAVLRAFREEYGPAPVLLGGLAPFLDRRKALPNCSYWREVDAVLQEEATDKAGMMCAYVNAEGLTDKGDQLHFDAASADELGRRYAASLRALSRPPEREVV